jgi:hypothetical protein
MSHTDYIARFGGVLCVFIFVHFFIDWIFQTHAEAMVKHNNLPVRAKHCAIYTAPFIPLLWWMGVSPLLIAVCACILFFSHLIEDTYLPVYYWALYIRRVPSMHWKRLDPASPELKELLDALCGFLRDEVEYKEVQKIEQKIARKGFKEFIDTTLGKILMVTIDQIIHISFLIPVVMIAIH